MMCVWIDFINEAILVHVVKAACRTFAERQFSLKLNNAGLNKLEKVLEAKNEAFMKGLK
jgi:hypothetical protein